MVADSSLDDGISNVCTQQQRDPASPAYNPDCISFDDYEDWLEDYVFPTSLEWAFIPLFGLIFLFGLIGNFLVVYAVSRDPSMRTVTNMFLLNLAIADFLVILVVLPFTVLWDVTETWFFGTAMCKIIVYCQTVTVSVSILTLTAISVERWYAICHPLAFRATLKRAAVTIISIWVIACSISLPEMIVLNAHPYTKFLKPNFTSVFITTCTDTWDDRMQLSYQLFQILVLYILPLVLMGAMYGHMATNLWMKSMPTNSESGVHRGATMKKQSKCSTTGSVISVSLALKPGRESTRRLSNASVREKSSSSSGCQVKESHSRRKVAKMLILIVVFFGICFLPVHLINILRMYGALSKVSPTTHSIITLISRMLCYTNSVINPVIYNFMSEKFRRQFRSAFQCTPGKPRQTPMKSCMRQTLIVANSTAIARRHCSTV